MLRELNTLEVIEINGGHHGAAYEAGKAVGRFIEKLAVVAGLVALCL